MRERYSSTLPDGCLLRQATANDIWSIRKLVLSAKLDPTQLRWEQFWVIGATRWLETNSDRN